MMNIQPRIKIIQAKKLIGQSAKMSMNDNKTFQIWNSFMKNKNAILNSIGSEMYSINIYENQKTIGDPNNYFEKWAAIQVSDFNNIPLGLKSLTLIGGEYAVFDYKGLSTDNTIFQYIFLKWLPNSKYTLDDRPHFEVLGDKYKNNDPYSEEEIWIPVKKAI